MHRFYRRIRVNGGVYELGDVVRVAVDQRDVPKGACVLAAFYLFHLQQHDICDVPFVSDATP